MTATKAPRLPGAPPPTTRLAGRLLLVMIVATGLARPWSRRVGPAGLPGGRRPHRQRGSTPTGTGRSSTRRTACRAAMRPGICARRRCRAEQRALRPLARDRRSQGRWPLPRGAAGARFAVQSAYPELRHAEARRSTTGSASHGYAAALKSSARAGHSEHQLGTTLDFRSYGGSAPWYYADWGTTQGRGVAQDQRLEVRLRHVLPEGQDDPDLLRVRAVALPLRRPDDGGQGPRQRPDPARVPVAPAERAQPTPTPRRPRPPSVPPSSSQRSAERGADPDPDAVAAPVHRDRATRCPAATRPRRRHRRPSRRRPPRQPTPVETPVPTPAESAAAG